MISTKIDRQNLLLATVTLVTFLTFGFPSATMAQQIRWESDVDLAKQQALASNRLVWLHFEADWCLPCKQLKTFVFSNPALIRSIQRNVVAVKVDADQREDLVAQLGVQRIPFDVIMTPEGRVIISRSSPKASGNYIRMIDDLDVPIEKLKSGNRDAINHGLDQVQQLAKKTAPAKLQSSDLDIDKPSHQMASDTVAGQRLRRGFEAANRAVSERAEEARRLKQQAELFIRSEERKQSEPEFSSNPFYKGKNLAKGAATNPASATVKEPAPRLTTNPFATAKLSNSFAPSKSDNDFVPPAPPRSLVVRSATPVSFGSLQSTRPPAPSVESANVVSTNDNRFSAAPVSTPANETPRFGSGGEFSFSPQRLVGQLAAAQAVAPNTPPQNDNSFAAASPADQEHGDRGRPFDNSFAAAVAPGSTTAVPQSATPVSKGKPSSITAKPPAITVVPSQPESKTPIASVQPAPGQASFVDTKIDSIDAKSIPNGRGNDQFFAPQSGSMGTTEGQLLPSAPRTRSGVSVAQSSSAPASQLVDQVDFFRQQPKAKSVSPDNAPSQALNLLNRPPQRPAFIARPQQASARAASFQAPVTAATSQSQSVLQVSDQQILDGIRSKYALQGKCPVTLLTESRWIDGQTEIGCVHRKRVYLFASQRHREVFQADPDAYSPLLAGFDPVVFEWSGKLVEGEEKFGVFMGEAPNQRIVLFSTAETRRQFQTAPTRYLSLIRQAMTDTAPKVNKAVKLR